MDSSISRNSADFVILGHDFQELDGYLQEWDKLKEPIDQADMKEANISKMKTVALARLENGFLHLLEDYTIPNCNNSRDSESYTDSSFSSTPSPFRLSISTNFSVNEINDLDLQIEELSSSQNYTAPVPELLHEEQQSNSGQHFNFPSIISIPELNLLPIQSQAIYYLRCIAERFIAAGSWDCVESYCKRRRLVMDGNMIKLGIETLNFRQVQILELDILNKKINRWIKAAKVAVKMMFANEKLLVNHIFNGLLWVDTAVDEFCFMQTVKGPAMQLFSFAEAVSRQTSPERLFMLLDVYEALSELLPDIEILFQGKYLESIHAQAVAILSKLAEAAGRMLEGLEKSLMEEIGSEVPQRGDILGLNRYVMKYLRFIADYSQPLTNLIACKPPSVELGTISGNLNMDFVEAESMSPFALHVNWIISILLFKLEQKSKLYENASLAHLFIMNNIHYMAWTIECCQRLKAVIGEDPNCLKRLTVQFRMAAIAYERSTWSAALCCLRPDYTSRTKTKSGIRARIKTFNVLYEAACKTQAKWFVPDAYLRQELRLSVSLKLVPAYRSFVGRFGLLLENGKYFSQNHIKYSVEEIEDAVFNLFEGDLARGRKYITRM